MRFVLVAVALLSLAALGCKGQCRQLSEKLCVCSDNSVDKDACLRRAAQQEGATTLSADDELRCEQLLPGCDCHTVNTAEGKRACGLAR